jgi:hypothetical protein
LSTLCIVVTKMCSTCVQNIVPFITNSYFMKALINLRKRLSLVLPVFACLLISACSKDGNVGADKTPTLTEFNSHYKKWKSQNLFTFSYKQATICGDCVYYGPYQITESSKNITSVKDRDGKTIANNTVLVLSMEELFQFVKASIQRNPEYAEVTYNAQYGYPQKVYFDFNKQLADEERGYTITGFSR